LANRWENVAEFRDDNAEHNRSVAVTHESLTREEITPAGVGIFGGSSGFAYPLG
jgi:hypothetical protein